MGEDLAVLRAEFPACRIWQEQVPVQVEYVAHSRHLGLDPRTVITVGVARLRGALEPAPAGDEGPGMLCAAEADMARGHSYCLSQEDHCAPDRAAADKVLGRFPQVAPIVLASCAFLTRAVRYLADQGITQFTGLGSGLPASPSVDEAARTVTAGARVVYADCDPGVLAHARALLVVDDRAGVAGGIGDPAALVTEAGRTV